jgi:cytochrome c-type biogenesis protein CcmF
MAVVLIGSLALVAGQSGTLRSTGRLDSALSRETVFLLNNLLLSAFCFTVVLGTLFPLVAEAVRGVKVSVGAPFFDGMTMPIVMALLFLVGVGPALPWKRASSEMLGRTFRIPFVMLLVGASVSLLAGTRNPYTILAFGFAGFALTVNLREFWIGARARMRAHEENFPVALQRLILANRHRYGGYTAHIGVLTIALGIAASSTFRSEVEATLAPGQAMQLRDWTFRFDSIWGRREPQRFVVGADVSILRGERFVQLLSPRQNFYDVSDQPVPTPSVRSRPSGDLYVNLMAFDQTGSTATLRALSEPLVGWIWAGGGILFLGALIAAWPARRRAPEAAYDTGVPPFRPAALDAQGGLRPAPPVEVAP